MKLAFEGGPDTGKASIEVPVFRSPTSLWLDHPRGEAPDLFGASDCSNKWCYSTGCTSDVYTSSQKKQRDRIASEIKLLLEDIESEKQRGKKGLKRLKQLMEDKDIIRLLPGAVPGFALRNRRWGKRNCYVVLDRN